MDSLVHNQIAWLRKTFVIFFTFKQFFICVLWWLYKSIDWEKHLLYTSDLNRFSPVCALVHDQIDWIRKVFLAYITLKQFFTSMDSSLIIQTAWCRKTFLTSITFKRFSLVCTHWCKIKLPDWQKHLLFFSHLKSFSSVFSGDYTNR